MNFEGRIIFNDKWVASQSFEAFAEHEKHHGLSKEQLKEIYDICKKMNKIEKPAS